MRLAAIAGLIMKRFYILMALAAIFLPLAAAQFSLRAEPREVGAQGKGAALQPHGFDSIAPDVFRMIDRSRSAAEQNQVRIERRVTVRIAPRARASDVARLAPVPTPSQARKLVLVDHADCIELDDILGVQPGDRRQLLLFTRNRQIIAASLDNKCSARAFYSGFYVERPDDGRLCVGRDVLQSRAGASCAVSDLHLLVEAAG